MSKFEYKFVKAAFVRISDRYGSGGYEWTCDGHTPISHTLEELEDEGWELSEWKVYDETYHFMLLRAKDLPF